MYTSKGGVKEHVNLWLDFEDNKYLNKFKVVESDNGKEIIIRAIKG